MADITLRVTPERLLNTSNQFTQSLGKVTNITRSIMGIVGSLRGSWAGDAANVFYNKLRGLDSDMNRLHRMIQEHADDLRDACRIFQQAERDNTQTNQTLKNNQIS